MRKTIKFEDKIREAAESLIDCCENSVKRFVKFTGLGLRRIVVDVERHVYCISGRPRRIQYRRAMKSWQAPRAA